MATTTAKVSFDFPDSFTETQYKNIERKVNTLCKNAEWDATYAIYASAFSIDVIITFDISERERFFYDAMRSPMQRLIDSHKMPATYGWSVYTPRAGA